MSRRHLRLNARQIAKEIFGGTMAAEDYTGEWVIYAIKKANALAVQAGVEEPLFVGRYSTPARVSAWIDAHPDFIAADVRRNPKEDSKEEPAQPPRRPRQAA